MPIRKRAFITQIIVEMCARVGKKKKKKKKDVIKRREGGILYDTTIV